MNQANISDHLSEKLSSRQSPVDAEGFWAPHGGLDWPWKVLLTRLRLMRGLTQRQLADLAGVAQSHVSKAESGCDVRLSTIVRLTEVLGCRLSLRVRPTVPFELR